MTYKKCAHDKCKRKAEEGSKYCSECIQLNTKSCMYCSNIMNTIKEYSNNKEKKSKHNFWINGLEKGENFFSFVQKLGSTLFSVLIFITVGFFWSSYLIGFKDESLLFSGVAILMLNLLKLIMFLVLGGLVFKYFCYYLRIWLSEKEEVELLKRGEEKYVNSKGL